MQVFTANHLPHTDKQNSIRTVATQKPSKQCRIQQNKTTLV